jgi:hypothetical protein
MSANSTFSALSGMRLAELRLETSAGKVANAGASDFLVRVAQASPAAPAGGAPSTVRNSAPVWMAAGGAADDANADVDLGAEALEQAEARTSFMANAKVLEVSQDMVKRLFELADSD